MASMHLEKLSLEERKFVHKELAKNTQFVELLELLDKRTNPELNQLIRARAEVHILVSYIFSCLLAFLRTLRPKGGIFSRKSDAPPQKKNARLTRKFQLKKKMIPLCEEAKQNVSYKKNRIRFFFSQRWKKTRTIIKRKHG